MNFRFLYLMQAREAADFLARDTRRYRLRVHAIDVEQLHVLCDCTGNAKRAVVHRPVVIAPECLAADVHQRAWGVHSHWYARRQLRVAVAAHQHDKVVACCAGGHLHASRSARRAAVIAPGVRIVNSRDVAVLVHADPVRGVAGPRECDGNGLTGEPPSRPRGGDVKAAGAYGNACTGRAGMGSSRDNDDL